MKTLSFIYLNLSQRHTSLKAFHIVSSYCSGFPYTNICQNKIFYAE